MTEDDLASDLSAFLVDHEHCGELGTGMTTTEPARVWITCTCGARIERPASALPG